MFASHKTGRTCHRQERKTKELLFPNLYFTSDCCLVMLIKDMGMPVNSLTFPSNQGRKLHILKPCKNAFSACKTFFRSGRQTHTSCILDLLYKLVLHSVLALHNPDIHITALCQQNPGQGCSHQCQHSER